MEDHCSDPTGDITSLRRPMQPKDIVYAITVEVSGTPAVPRGTVEDSDGGVKEQGQAVVQQVVPMVDSERAHVAPAMPRRRSGN